MTNKERAKLSRDRKKEYTDMLEKKIEELEKQVKELTFELEKYKKKEMYQDVSEKKEEFKTPNIVKTSVIDNVIKSLKKCDPEGTKSIPYIC